jgi:hypothetical protein
MCIIRLTEIPIIGAVPIMDSVNKLFEIGRYTVVP